MCCTRDFGAEMKLKKLLQRKKKIKAWKVYVLRQGRWTSPVFWAPLIFGTAGWIVSDRDPELQLKVLANNIFHGLHVYLDREAAEFLRRKFGLKKGVVVPVWCYEKDFVGSGTSIGEKSAVFNKVRVEAKSRIALWTTKTFFGF
jgi:hypothetical protein